MNGSITSYSIAVDGKPIGDSLRLNTISIGKNKEENRAVLSIISAVATRFDVPENISLGAQLTIALGYESKNEIAFEGKIEGIQLSTKQSHSPMFSFMALDGGGAAKQRGNYSIEAEDVVEMNVAWGIGGVVNNGYIVINGNNNFDVGMRIDLSKLISSIDKSDVISIEHSVKNEQWLTTLYF